MFSFCTLSVMPLLLLSVWSSPVQAGIVTNSNADALGERQAAGPAPLMDERSAQANYYYSFWQEGSGSHNCNNGPGGSYTAKWSGGGGFVCGKGWNSGGSRTIKYNGTYHPSGPGYLSVYGWTRNPLVEFYIVESHGDLAPGEPWTPKGNFSSDEGEYLLYESTRRDKPSIDGTRTFQQYWSVRTEKRTAGTVSTARHFSEWAKAGMGLGAQQYMIVATEGYANGSNLASGSSDIAIIE